MAVTIDRVEEMPAKGKGGGRTAVLATVLMERKAGESGRQSWGNAQNDRPGCPPEMGLIDGPVYLELFVKVVPDWRGKPQRLNELGYSVDAR